MQAVVMFLLNVCMQDVPVSCLYAVVQLKCSPCWMARHLSSLWHPGQHAVLLWHPGQHAVLLWHLGQHAVLLSNCFLHCCIHENTTSILIAVERMIC